MADEHADRQTDPVWRLVSSLRGADYGRLLPWLGRLPLGVGSRLAHARGRLHAAVGSDWRSLSLGFRHVSERSGEAYAQLFPQADPRQIRRWQVERYLTEARYQYECTLVIEGRLEELSCNYRVDRERYLEQTAGRGLLLLSPHYDSFVLGVGLVGLLFKPAGRRVNLLTSAMVKDARVHPAIQAHFADTYRTMARYMNGGCSVDMEGGSQPFIDMLARGEVVVMAGDAPPLHYGAVMQQEFLGAQRKLAGGALRMAAKAGARVGGYLCHFRGPGRYEVDFTAVQDVADAASLAPLYRDFSQAIEREPGRWWASDLLLAMPPVEPAPAAADPLPAPDVAGAPSRSTVVLLGDSWFDGKWTDRIGPCLAAALDRPVVNRAVGGSTSGAPLGAPGDNNLVLTLEAGATGFTAGQTVRQDHAAATVWSWNEASRRLVLVQASGRFEVDGPVTGSAGGSGRVATVQEYGLRARLADDLAAAGGASAVGMALISVGGNDKIAGLLSGCADRLAQANAALYDNLAAVLRDLTQRGIFCVLCASVDFQLGDFDLAHVFTYPADSDFHWDVRIARTTPFRDDDRYQALVDACDGRAMLVEGAMSRLFNQPARWIDFSGNSQGVHPTVGEGYHAGVAIPSTPAIPVPVPGEPGVPTSFAGYGADTESGYQVFADVLIAAIRARQPRTV